MGTGGAFTAAATGDPFKGLRSDPVRRPTISDIGLLEEDDRWERRLPIETWLRLSPMVNP